MLELSEEQNIEGFICPECFSVFSSDDQLLSHIFHRHPTESNKQVLKSFAFYDCERSGPKVLCHSLTSDFFERRRNYVNSGLLELNILLIRLEKLITSPNVPNNDRRVFEQSVVPWVDTKVSLCPYCGKSFGLGKETDFSDEEPNKPSQYGLENQILDTAVRGGKAVSRLAYAILDYSPVYRRRHHCRLCGHVLCADCSFFLSEDLGKYIISANGPQEYDLSFVHKSIPIKTNVGEMQRFEKSTIPFGDIDISITNKVKNPAEYHLRICGVCKIVLERKINRLNARFFDSPVVQFYKELEELKGKVTYLLRDYLAAVQGLDPVMNKYTSEDTKSWHSDIITAFQQLERLGHRIKSWSAASSQITDGSSQINNTVIRLAHALSCATRNFIQQTLPTFQQYSLLISQTKGTHNTHWTEDQVALVELSKRIGSTSEI